MVALLDLEVVVREIEAKGAVRISLYHQLPASVLFLCAAGNLELASGTHSVLHVDCEILLHECADVKVDLRAKINWHICDSLAVTKTSVILNICTSVNLVYTHAVNLHFLDGGVYLDNAVDLVVLVEEYRRGTYANIADIQ